MLVMSSSASSAARSSSLSSIGSLPGNCFVEYGTHTKNRACSSWARTTSATSWDCGCGWSRIASTEARM